MAFYGYAGGDFERHSASQGWSSSFAVFTTSSIKELIEDDTDKITRHFAACRRGRQSRSCGDFSGLFCTRDVRGCLADQVRLPRTGIHAPDAARREWRVVGALGVPDMHGGEPVDVRGGKLFGANRIGGFLV